MISERALYCKKEGGERQMSISYTGFLEQQMY